MVLIVWLFVCALCVGLYWEHECRFWADSDSALVLRRAPHPPSPAALQPSPACRLHLCSLLTFSQNSAKKARGRRHRDDLRPCVIGYAQGGASFTGCFHPESGQLPSPLRTLGERSSVTELLLPWPLMKGRPVNYQLCNYLYFGILAPRTCFTLPSAVLS